MHHISIYLVKIDLPLYMLISGKSCLYNKENMLLKILSKNHTTQFYFKVKRVFTREISSRDETRRGMKLSLSMVKCLSLFTRFCRNKISSQNELIPGWNFIPGWKKEKKTSRLTSSRDEILKWACFFNFWRMYSSTFSKFNKFEHNESMNIMKYIRPLCKKWSPKRKRMSTANKK